MNHHARCPWVNDRLRREFRVFLTLALVILVIVNLGCRSESEPDSKDDAQTASAQPSTDSATPAESTPTTTDALALVDRPLTAIHGDSQIELIYRSGTEAGEATILESLGGGAGVIDYDLDGRPDLVLPGGGQLSDHVVRGVASQLLRNRGDWQFSLVSTAAEFGRASNYTHGAAVGDFDSDGFPDVLITGYGGLQLWRNQGDGSFREWDVAASGLKDPAWSTSAAWGDLNGDGLPDLYVPHYVDWSFDNHPFFPADHDPKVREIGSPRRFASQDDAVFLNQGDGTFVAAGPSMGLPSGGKGLGAMILDVDRDGFCDVYVANDTTANFLLLGNESGTLTEEGGLAGVAMDDRGIPNGSMGIAAGDSDGDGSIDLWVANYQSETFAMYVQQQPRIFRYASAPLGLRALEATYVGFGTVMTDLDRDGDHDLVVANGHVLLHPQGSTIAQLPLVLERHENRYRRLTWPETHRLGTASRGRGLAQADFDGDGDGDLVWTPSDEPAWLLENAADSSGRALTIRPIGTQAPRIPIGATLEVVTDQQTRVYPLVGGSSYLSTHEPVWFVTIPDGESLQQLIVHWPRGATESFAAPASNTNALLLIEGQGAVWDSLP